MWRDLNHRTIECLETISVLDIEVKVIKLSMLAL